ncbi:MAG: hypothetical protein KDD60_13360, partial [Bdellovibrionales bacterium]|nr:hypothetical protein [Bdellovibrionales bacterium]
SSLTIFQSIFRDNHLTLAALHHLEREGDIARNGNAITLLSPGRKRAVDVLENYDFWEQFLIEKLRLDRDHVSETAQILEHMPTQKRT